MGYFIGRMYENVNPLEMKNDISHPAGKIRRRKKRGSVENDDPTRWLLQSQKSRKTFPTRNTEEEKERFC